MEQLAGGQDISGPNRIYVYSPGLVGLCCTGVSDLPVEEEIKVRMRRFIKLRPLSPFLAV